MITIEYEKLTKDFIEKNQPCTLKVIKSEIDFYIKINLKKQNEKLVVMSNGAFDRKNGKLPVFMRSSWVEDIDASCIYLDDRTIHENNLALGWGIGTKERYYLNDYSQIVKKIAKLLKYNDSNIYYYGSSAGGFMSLMLSIRHENTTAIVNNPQIYVYNYVPVFVKQLFTRVFPDLSQEEIIKKYPLRLSVTALMKKREYVPRIYYLQNRLAQSDMENHYNIFFKRLDLSHLDSSKVTSILYNNEKLGHNPIGKPMTIKFINTIINI